MNDLEYITNALDKAEAQTYSYQCPYLALAEVLGFTSSYEAQHLPSHFGRLSMRKMIMNTGINTKYAQPIYHMLEDGYTLGYIAKYLRAEFG